MVYLLLAIILVGVKESDIYKFADNFTIQKQIRKLMTVIKDC